MKKPKRRLSYRPYLAPETKRMLEELRITENEPLDSIIRRLIMVVKRHQQEGESPAQTLIRLGGTLPAKRRKD